MQKRNDQLAVGPPSSITKSVSGVEIASVDHVCLDRRCSKKTATKLRVDVSPIYSTKVVNQKCVRKLKTARNVQQTCEWVFKCQ